MPTETQPDVVPMIAYEDGPAAMDWLNRAFGFEERTRMLDKSGRLSHGEMRAGSGLVMLASPTPEYQAPLRHRQECAAAAGWSAVPYIVDGVLVYVDHIDGHYRRARKQGARILTELESDQYGRRYRAEDLEGHRWMFMERS
jgi:PhnB protein